MKSLLVDAMRQANKGDKGAALSDSGSFDTTSDQFTETANDSVVDTPQPLADDLQLMDPDAPESDAIGIEALTNSADPVPPALSNAEIPEPATGRNLSAEFIALDAAVPAVGRAPRLSQFSPVICLAVFLAAGLVWVGWQNWQEQATGSKLDGSRIPGAPLHSASGESDAGSQAERFPFISATESAASMEPDE